MATHAAPSRRRLRGSSRRLRPIVLDLAIALGVCLLGYRYGAEALQEREARWVVTVLRWLGVDGVSAAVPRHILVLGGREPILAEVTASCSAALSILGLTALALTVLRRRRQHAVAGLVVAATAMLALNHLRLLGSAASGLWWGNGALVLFHDWVGTLWNLAATLLGYLLMVWVTLPPQERAEQDVDGRHTARRPPTWARPGLGYRTRETDLGLRRRAVTITGLLHRYVLPRRVSTRLAARREAARIDYRIGHLAPAEQVERIEALAADGLGAHAASLLAVATYEEDAVVLDGLAAAVAARQWEPITGPDVAALRLWARGWSLARSSGRTRAVPVVPAPRTPPSFLLSGPPRSPDARRPRTFARPAIPAPTPLADRPEELR